MLLEDRFAPVTWEIGFIEEDAERVANAFVDWHSSLVGRFRCHTVEGDLRQLLCTLAPLTDGPPQRCLFVPTKSRWTAYFDNGHQGTDAFPVMSQLAEDLGCRALRTSAIPENAGGEVGGAVLFELYGPERREFLNYERSIGVAKDGRRWKFYEVGQPLPFEDRDQYTKTKVRDRFTVELLQKYLRDLGDIRLFDDAFYAPDRQGYVVKGRVWLRRPARDFPLADCAE